MSENRPEDRPENQSENQSERQHVQQRQHPERAAGPGGFDDFADSAGAVLVSHGTYLESLPVVGMTVGAVRTRSQDRLDIHPEATALVDGRRVDDSTRLHAGQTLMFVRPSGEKGALARSVKRSGRASASSQVSIEGDRASATLPEGQSVSLAVSELVRLLGAGCDDAILPDGVKCLLPIPGGCIAIHQRPPSVFNFRWIAPESPADFGPGTSYREVRLALPYLVVFGVFEHTRRGLRLGNRNECFFVNQPLDAAGLATELCFPALLNCSRFPDDPRHPLSWICTQHLGMGDRGSRESFEQTLRTGMRALLHHLLETGFNRSSENHELNSWFSETVSAEIDPRIASVGSWEQATADDPLFALEVPWLSTGHTVREVADRIIAASGGAQAVTTASDIARVIVNAQPKGSA